jgi:hypothetical protein
VPTSDPGLNRSATERRPSDFNVVVKGFVKYGLQNIRYVSTTELTYRCETGRMLDRCC